MESYDQVADGNVKGEIDESRDEMVEIIENEDEPVDVINIKDGDSIE